MLIKIELIIPYLCLIGLEQASLSSSSPAFRRTHLLFAELTCFSPNSPAKLLTLQYYNNKYGGQDLADKPKLQRTFFGSETEEKPKKKMQ
jgi:hypothetical protein